MEWNRSETLALAAAKCSQCAGYGLRTRNSDGSGEPCGCVLRAIFRKCYERFEECATETDHTGWLVPDMGASRDLPGTWSRKNEEYVADFLLIAKRTLTPEENQLFRFRFVLGADWKLCCRRMKLERGDFFHQIYRIQAKLGRVFRELQPYGLFPADEYFGSGMRSRPLAKVISIRPEATDESPTLTATKKAPVAAHHHERFPLKKVA